jgi:hypothetical protein
VADRCFLSAGVLLAASLEPIGTRLEVAGTRGAHRRIGLSSTNLHCLNGLVGTGLVVRAPRGTASIDFAAAAETILTADLEMASAIGAIIALRSAGVGIAAGSSYRWGWGVAAGSSSAAINSSSSYANARIWFFNWIT